MALASSLPLKLLLTAVCVFWASYGLAHIMTWILVTLLVSLIAVSFQLIIGIYTMDKLLFYLPIKLLILAFCQNYSKSLHQLLCYFTLIPIYYTVLEGFESHYTDVQICYCVSQIYLPLCYMLHGLPDWELACLVNFSQQELFQLDLCYKFYTCYLSLLWSWTLVRICSSWISHLLLQFWAQKFCVLFLQLLSALLSYGFYDCLGYFLYYSIFFSCHLI